ncbi:putative secreted aspartic proteinase precursor [Rosellinia necatrix]|uniref:Putative secreted aspartic proteinase n=1 Tax=Rosellinia necatrix TaxID=77044 RepID=A0A1S7UMU9_ROSNE|nr:putative secreted aspartic proteinase precursor [Rosellinia necatrix]
MVPHPTIIALTAALAGLASSTPLQPKIGSFSVSQVANIKFKPHGPSQLAKTFSKYGVSLPEGLARNMASLDAARLLRRSSGNVTTTPEQFDIEYLTPVQIGTPPQTLNLDVDSGSSDLWVFSTETAPGSVKGQALYNPKKSSTAKKVDGATWMIHYGDGSASDGTVYHDTVSVGGVTVKGQAVESAAHVSTQFTRDINTDGLLGLAFSSINTVQPTQELTWFDNAAKSLDAAVWTADLQYHKPGTYSFGAIDDSKYTGDIKYVKANSSDGFWMFEMSGYGIGNGTFKASTFHGIADTGTTLALLPAKIVKAYYATVTGARVDTSQGGFIFPCKSRLPDFVLGVGRAKIRIPGRYINYSPAEGSGKLCFGGIQSDEGIGFSIIGDIALKAAFVVFDATSDKPRLGWANKKV